MEYNSVGLISGLKHRYKFLADLYDIRRKEFKEVIMFLDLGCFNTMIPKRFAVTSGRPLGFKRSYSVGGSIVETEAFLISKIMINGTVLERVVAFAADFAGELEDNILIGTNVMNNWEMVIHKKSNTFKFREDLPEDLPNKVHAYQNYFDKDGNYVCVQDTDKA
jgi:hypothetical protein